MCGRYTLHSSPERIARHFEVDPGSIPELEPRYNVAPAQQVPAVGPSSRGEGRGVAQFRWGLVPHWARDPSDLPSLINARSETAHEKPAFRDAFARRRCVVPADGFYEWRREAGGKQPYYVSLPGDALLGFAGLWDRWTGQVEGEPVRVDSCTILTTDASPSIRELHDRMPVILEPGEYGLWLDRRVTGRDRLESLLGPLEDGRLEFYRVSRRVNRPENDDPACIEPAEGAGG